MSLPGTTFSQDLSFTCSGLSLGMCWSISWCLPGFQSSRSPWVFTSTGSSAGVTALAERKRIIYGSEKMEWTNRQPQIGSYLFQFLPCTQKFPSVITQDFQQTALKFDLCFSDKKLLVTVALVVLSSLSVVSQVKIDGLSLPESLHWQTF